MTPTSAAATSNGVKPLFSQWVGQRSVASLGTNAGSGELPFQQWRHFKEAFAPELVQQAIVESPIRVATCLDPFGGSGTTALACQFLGLEPRTIEVNPFLADLIEAKLTTYDSDQLAHDLGRVLRTSAQTTGSLSAAFANAPPTFVEPGVNGRWIFDRDVAEVISRILHGIASIESASHRRLLRVLLGGILVDVSNVLVNGKGRRYRQRWRDRPVDPDTVPEAFRAAVELAIADVRRFRDRPCLAYRLYRGDCRQTLPKIGTADLAVFSPPYPNSFDYTDVYNVELWVLGYLDGSEANRRLRRATLSSHVQISRKFPPAPLGSPALTCVLEALRDPSASLWDGRIPDMVGAYFADMHRVLRALHQKVTRGGSAWLVVGDSRYSQVHIPSAVILSDLAPALGWNVERIESFRSMRGSAQSGGHLDLAETLLVLTRSPI